MWKPIDKIVPSKKHSRKVVTFQCQCRLKTIKSFPWKNYATGCSKSCGKCTYLIKEDLEEIKGLLSPIISNLEFPISRNSKIEFECLCGNKKFIVVKSVLNGLTKSCGCLLKGKSPKFLEHSLSFKGRRKTIIKQHSPNSKPPDWWRDREFGFLTIVEDLSSDLSIKSERKIKCLCKCGRTHEARASHITSGKIKSCGKCSIVANSWWKTKKDIDKYPSNLIELNKFLSGSWLEALTFSKKKLRMKCLRCNNVFTPRFHDVFLKEIKSCGCLSNKVSRPTIEINEFLNSLGVASVIEHKIGDYSVDLFVPSHNLVVEHHGLRYHSSYFGKTPIDQKKFSILTTNHDVVVIYEDEWRDHKNRVKLFLSHKLNKAKRDYVRPQKCEIIQISAAQVRPFYDANHYLGFRSAKHHLGVFFNGELVAVMSVHTPSRQSPDDFEIVRMCGHPNVGVRGIWSYLVKKLPNFGIFGRVSSFSDNRLSNGSVYQKSGFSFEREVKPDYWYTDHHNRYHKSKLRKSVSERQSGSTEESLRRKQGLYKIVDFGKKKWVLDLPRS